MLLTPYGAQEGPTTKNIHHRMPGGSPALGKPDGALLGMGQLVAGGRVG